MTLLQAIELVFALFGLFTVLAVFRRVLDKRAEMREHIAEAKAQRAHEDKQ